MKLNKKELIEREQDYEELLEDLEAEAVDEYTEMKADLKRKYKDGAYDGKIE